MRLAPLTTSPRLQIVAAAALLLTACLASDLHSARWSPEVPGYRRIGVAGLRDPLNKLTLDERRVWITGGVGWCGQLCAPFQGDHPDFTQNIDLHFPATSVVRPPATGLPFSPYGVLHVKQDDPAYAHLSLDVVGETASGLVPQSASVVAITLAAGAACALVSSVTIVSRHARARRRASQFGPGRCRSCGYDLRASERLCPECGTPAAVAGTAPAAGVAPLAEPNPKHDA